MRVLLAAWFLISVAAASTPALAAGVDPGAPPPGAYALDPQHARLIARIGVGPFGYALRFSRLAGSFSYDPANWRTPSIAITVDPRSVDNNWAAAHVFEADRYPVIRFASTALTPTGTGRGQLTGELTLHGVTRPIVLNVQFRGAAPSASGARMVFSGSGRIRRSQFRLVAGSPWVGDEVDLRFDVEFARTSEQARAQTTPQGPPL